jgi:hypothetical protein
MHDRAAGNLKSRRIKNGCLLIEPDFGFANGVVNVTLAAVAKAGGASQPVIYVEFRKNGIPVDPSPIVGANESQKVRG